MRALTHLLNGWGLKALTAGAANQASQGQTAQGELKKPSPPRRAKKLDNPDLLVKSRMAR
jgi:hypothetical protein